MSDAPSSDARHITVFLVDDHEVVREGLRRMLERCADMVVVGEAGSAQQALRGIRELSPHVVLLDLNLPGVQGLDVLATLQQEEHPPAVLILTVHDDDELVRRAARGGARGYVLKHTSLRELAAAIRRVAGGGTYYDQDVLGALLGVKAEADQVALTSRELDVLRLLAAGLTNREIGARLFLSPETVKTHLQSLYRKLGVEGRAHAVAIALRRGYLT